MALEGVLQHACPSVPEMNHVQDGVAFDLPKQEEADHLQPMVVVDDRRRKRYVEPLDRSRAHVDFGSPAQVVDEQARPDFFGLRLTELQAVTGRACTRQRVVCFYLGRLRRLEIFQGIAFDDERVAVDPACEHRRHLAIPLKRCQDFHTVRDTTKMILPNARI